MPTISTQRVATFAEAKNLKKVDISRKMHAPYDLYIRNKMRHPQFYLTEAETKRLAKALGVTEQSITIQTDEPKKQCTSKAKTPKKEANTTKEEPKTVHLEVPAGTKYVIAIIEKKGAKQWDM